MKSNDLSQRSQFENYAEGARADDAPWTRSAPPTPVSSSQNPINMRGPESEPDALRDGPHQGQPMAQSGAPLDTARAAVILVHGRGATARSILALADELDREDVAYIAPQASGNTWYPYSFLAPIEQNEPGLSSGVRAIDDARRRIEAAGIPPERTVVLGFSQGACLGLEYVARNSRRYGGVVAFSGGLIGTGSLPNHSPPDDKIFEYEGSLDGTPVFIGCSDIDSHIPVKRVRQSAEAMEKLGGDVTARIYPNMGHTINEDELTFTKSLIADVVRSA